MQRSTVLGYGGTRLCGRMPSGTLRMRSRSAGSSFGFFLAAFSFGIESSDCVSRRPMPNAALRTARAYRTASARSLQRRTWRRLDARRRADGFSTDTPLGTQPCWCAEYSTQRVANWPGWGGRAYSPEELEGLVEPFKQDYCRRTPARSALRTAPHTQWCCIALHGKELMDTLCTTFLWLCESGGGSVANLSWHRHVCLYPCLPPSQPRLAARAVQGN